MNAVNESEEVLIDSLVYILIHELGHAFIDIYRLQFMARKRTLPISFL